MNVLQKRVFTCSLIEKMNRDPLFSKSLEIVNTSLFRERQNGKYNTEKEEIHNESRKKI